MPRTEPRPARSASTAPAVDVVAVRMGYGHLRPAHALASAAGVAVMEADGASLTGVPDRLLWHGSRWIYEGLSRLSGIPVGGTPAARVLAALTRIPPRDAHEDLSRPDVGSRALATAIRLGFGRRTADYLRRRNTTLVATFYAPAHAAAARGHPAVMLVVTDTDVARVWVENDPAQGSVVYCVPTESTGSRLLRYGVPPRRIRVTGFPLPQPLANEEAAEANLASRCRRLRGEDGPVHLALAIGGAGAQAGLALEVAGALLPLVSSGRLRITLVAGTRGEVARRFERAVRTWRNQVHVPPRSVQVLFERRPEELFERFDRLLAGTDLLWTKPSELVFFAALGLPLILAPAVGAQEEANRSWLLHVGAGMDQPSPEAMLSWLGVSLESGAFLEAARRGFSRLPRDGTRRVLAEAKRLRQEGSREGKRPGGASAVFTDPAVR